MTAAIHFETEAYQVTQGKPMGRHFAGYGFLSAFARHASAPALTGYVRNSKLGEEFCRFINEFRPDRSPNYIVAAMNVSIIEYCSDMYPDNVSEAVVETVDTFMDFLKNGIGTKADS